MLDFSSQIAGPYCSKLFVDAGAEVIKVEPLQGDSLRRYSASGSDLGDTDSALFRYLNAGKKSVVGSATDAHVTALLAQADLVIEAHGLAGDDGECLEVDGLRRARPSLVVLSITPYGLSGPWAQRLATEFTLQAECGSIGVRGLPGGEPFQAGGRIAEWAAGTYGAAAALAALFGTRRHGGGEHIDLSIFESANMIYSLFSETTNRLLNGGPGDPEHAFVVPSVETPSIEPTTDGYVGFCTNARQQFANFLRLIERPDLLDDKQLASVAGRALRFEEWTAIVRAWCSARSTEEITERAARLRIPVSPVLNGETVLTHEHLLERNTYVASADGDFLQPRRPYRIDHADPPPPGPAPALDPTAGTVSFTRAGKPWGRDEGEPAVGAGGAEPDTESLPLVGLKVLDLTAWWAGPVATAHLAAMGATVVHVESARRPDGMRMVGRGMGHRYGQWWEVGPQFMHSNANKLGVTLDLSDERGRRLLERLVVWADAVVENFTPRVLAGFGLGWERVQELNPGALLVRMPAFGLSGPWRDQPGFAQTIEQLSGLAWITGHRDDQPRVPRGPCDPVAGMHAAFAILVALARHQRSGIGHHVESTLAESALNIAAEQVLEWTAYGNRLDRMGNRSRRDAPQGLYLCADTGSPTAAWLALSITTDDQWRGLTSAMGDPEWATDPAFDTRAGRGAAHDAIDARVAAWTRTRRRAELVAELRRRQVPASEVADPCRIIETNPQVAARRFFETPEHPVAGPMPLPSAPFRFTGVDRWLRTPAPTLGRDNALVLGTVLGVSGDELAQLETDGVIGTTPVIEPPGGSRDADARSTRR